MTDTGTSLSDTASTPSSPSNVTPTVVAFGTTGAGKSSVINMLPDNPAYPPEVATTKASVTGVTTEVKHFNKMVDGRPFTIVDTMGTGEIETGSVPTHLAIERLYDHLVASSTPAIHLVLIVMRAGRMTSLDECNYLIARYLFGDEVPIALVLTHMDNMEDMDTWWDEQENRGRLGLLKAVGVVSFVGRRNVLEPFYNKSREDLSRFVSTQLRDGRGFKLQGKPRVSLLTGALANLVTKYSDATRFHAATLELLKDYEIEDQYAKPLATKLQVVAPLPVVIFVGARGSGKTTLINMLQTDNQDARDTSAPASIAGDVQGCIRIVKGQRIRVLETLGIPLPSANSPSLSRAVRALYDSFMAHPLGVRLVVLVAKLEGEEDLAPIDITHYRAIRQFCGDRVAICLVTLQHKNRSSRRLTRRHKDLVFQRHLNLVIAPPGPAQRQNETWKRNIRAVVASLVKALEDSPVQPVSNIPKLLQVLPGYESVSTLKDSGDMETLEGDDSLPSSQQRRRVLLFGGPGAGTTSVVKMFNEAPRAKEFDLIDDNTILPRHFHSGLSLLIVVLSASRTTYADAFAHASLKAASEGQIPVRVVFTHTQTVDDPNAWWEDSKQRFIQAKIMVDSAHPPTCVTATRGPIIKQETGERAYDAQYEASVVKLEKLFLDNALPTPYRRPKLPDPTAFEKIKAKVAVRFGRKAPGYSEYCFQTFHSSGWSVGDAKEITNNRALREYLTG